MIKYIKLTGLLLLITTVSCSKLQDDLLNVASPSSLETQTIFSNIDLTKNAIDGILVPIGETNSYRGRYIPWYGMNTDAEWYNSSESTSNDNADLCIYDTKANNSLMNTTNNVWAQMYLGIDRANQCIVGIRQYGSPTVGSAFGYYLGTALTYRAIYYADLLKTWGDVPARFQPTDINSVYVPKSSRDVIYKQIIADLAEAEELVPWPNGGFATNDTEHINKAFVKGLRARLAMAASGFQQYPDGVRRSTDADLSVAKMYKIALDECRSVITSGSASLVPSFETLWRNLNKEVLTAGSESLWEIPFAAGRGRVLFTFAVRHTTNDQFQQNGANRGGQGGPLPNVFYDYNVKDLRRDVTCVPYLWGAAVNGIAKQQLGAINKWYFGKYRYEWMTRLVTSTNDDGVNKIYMRYAEILLIAAEAANELEGPSSAAPYLKQIRARAFSAADQPTQVDAYVNSLSSKPAMFTAIVNENKYEFTGEMERKQSLIRWNLLGANLANAKAQLTDLKNRAGAYTDVPKTLYFKYAADGFTLQIYGLNRGETTNPGAGWTSIDWTVLTDSKIAALYKNNPDTKQFWPIWQVFIDTSNGTLKNDYGY
ncbi:RagB/SusD family nutrient uptake outer membrane protein [Halpernia frigidisoli]|uniref:Starch-binding associating with outer membrane n=1 Tax=Halpernia frigidisoli TaxID=1125876 RepID=A0A1I3IW41_9FLAO|nr:RagB/SusD family nutrient uptake outer membrane protein [Halpernia frigidisoli]SFI52117.1 Starch-binding associating with outer membrane [Halpernia frigidisoli]